MRMFTSEDFKLMPWKNGSGVTLELYRFPETGEFDLRISSATVATSGPFSLYPGVRRWLVALDGEGLELKINTREIQLKPGDPAIEFSGDTEITCDLLGGPVTDFNVMLKEGFGSVVVRSCLRPETHECTGDELFLYLPSEKILYRLTRGEKLDVSSPRVSVERYRRE